MIYLDNHATTRVDPQVLEAMLPWFGEHYGNPGSVVHEFGEVAREAVDTARASIAQAIDADPAEIVFTSGATESNNLALRGVADRSRRRGDHIISVTTEHRAVLDPLARLSKRNFQVDLLEVAPHGSDRPGSIDTDDLANRITDKTCLVSIMLGNNEIGIVQSLSEVSKVCRRHGVLLHCDATQAVGKLPVSVQKLGVDLMSFTAHKLYGPKGIGALYVRRRDPIVRLEPLLIGGGQERGRRSGTLNVPGIVGFARALELCLAEMPTEQDRLKQLRDRLFHGLVNAVDGIQLLGPSLTERQACGTPSRLANNLNIGFDGLDGEALMMRAPEIAVSSGAACSASDPQPSHVLQALGLSADQARSSLRFGLGRFNTESEVDLAVERLAAAASDLRHMA